MSNAGYAMGRSDEEHQRLVDQAAILQPLTERLFRAAGIGKGMRVLDVGSGMGDVALLLGDLVGPTGEVVSVDVDEAALAKASERAAIAGAGHVRFMQGDVSTATIPGTFDAAVGRLVLLHFADPAAGLRAIAKRVRPGGTIAFQEWDLDPQVPSRSFPTTDSLWDVTISSVIEIFAAAGVHLRMGRRLVQEFVQAGLPSPELLEQTTTGGGRDYKGYDWLANTMRSVAPLGQTLGIQEVERLGPFESLADRMREEALARNLVVWSPPLIGAYSHTV